MRSQDDAAYRLRLAEGFLKEAEEDLTLKRWRSCVDSSQLSVENAGKAIIAIFEPVEKTHDPSTHLRRLLDQGVMDQTIAEAVEKVTGYFTELGFEEHFLTDYGDEIRRTDPWSLFDETDAREALKIAEKCFETAKGVYDFYFSGS